MINKSLNKTPMNELDPNVRNTNFLEVATGYTLEEAINEANRCLECKTKPCVDGCPVGVPIPEFIKEVKSGNIQSAYEIISRENDLPAICGRVCPQEEQCEGLCVRTKKGEAVGIGRLERYVADHFEPSNEIVSPIKNNIKIAVIGAGPAGITCAGNLAKLGYEVTIFEALHEVGGVLLYGIPEFRLPNDVIKKELQKIIDLGVHIEKNVIIGKSLTIDDLISDGFKSIFIGSGAGLPRFMNIPGESLNGVYSANEFLTRVNLMRAFEFPTYSTPVKLGENVAIVGGGNVAMDAARTAKRIGAKNVYIIYRRGMDELPARLEEIHHAKEEGIIFNLLTNPIEIIGENNEVSAIKCVRMELGEADESGRRSPQVIPDSEFILPMNNVIMAIGTSPNNLITSTTKELKTKRSGVIIVNEETMETSMENVYAGGDVVSGAATVILAMGAGKLAAEHIHSKLNTL